MAENEEYLIKINEVLTDFSNNDIDVYAYSGPIQSHFDDAFIDICEPCDDHKSAILYLSTYGGDANAAYRIAKILKKRYQKWSVFIHKVCKSAGTLLAIGANVLIMSEFSQIGPLDVQLLKKDELGERSSGLTIWEAMSGLKSQSFSMFEEIFLSLRFKSGQQITTKSAAEIAANITVGLFNPLYSQIDPMRFGEASRANRIALEYGIRLRSNNLKENSLEKLVFSYPDHSFVIDQDEAKQLFKTVNQPEEREIDLDFLISGFMDEFIDKDEPFLINLTKSHLCDISNANPLRKEEDLNDQQCGPHDDERRGSQEKANTAN